MRNAIARDSRSTPNDTTACGDDENRAIAAAKRDLNRPGHARATTGKGDFMAEDGNSDNQAANGQGEAAARQIVVHAQYIKDISFENPNAPDILINPPSQPDVQIGVNVGARGLNSEQYEVLLSLSAKAQTEDKALFLAELTYAAIVSAPGASREDLNPLIMIEAPRLMFPFARPSFRT